MKKKYQIALVVIGCLVVLIGLSYAYFVATSTGGGAGGDVTVNTYTIDNVGFSIEGILEFNDLDIYPGHKNVSQIKVTAIGNDDIINYKLLWEGINSLNTPLKYYVYKTDTKENPSITCKKEIEQIGASKYYYETCEESNFTNLGEIISEGEITKAESNTEFVLKNDEVIKGTSDGNVIYYYVVLEYPNLDESQNIDMGGKFEGLVTVKKEENLIADITIKKMYQEIEDGYREITSMPEEGYIINTAKSTCTNNATPMLKNNKILVKNLQTSGTECNIYFDKLPTSEDTIGNLGITVNDTTPNFAASATTDEGVFKTEDPVYGGYSYYWRGAVTNNYVTFGGYCWRIIRINGDGSIRMIYDGTTCHANGTSTAESIAKTSIQYNTTYNNSSYVGWTYTAGTQRTLSGTASNAKTQLESWYTSSLASYASKIADGKYCNDRRTQNDEAWRATGATQFYAGYQRLQTNKQPSLGCDAGDVYTLKVGLITVDEVMLAGGTTSSNSNYYLYNGQYYWTMSPYQWYGSYARVFIVNSTGNFTYANVYSTNVGLRPVINLKSDTTFAIGGNGTQSNPFVVEG